MLPSRIDAAKSAAKKFVGLLPTRINLGLVTFGGQANVLVPPTLEPRRRSRRRSPGCTCRRPRRSARRSSPRCRRSRRSRKSTTAKGEKPPPARIVLLSDGSNTVGRSVTVGHRRGAKTAHVAGVDDRVRHADRHGDHRRRRRSRCRPTTPTLQRIAAQTGGSFHTAHSRAGARSRSTRTSARRSATRPRTATSAGASCSTGLLVPVRRRRGRRCSGPGGWSDACRLRPAGRGRACRPSCGRAGRGARRRPARASRSAPTTGRIAPLGDQLHAGR